MKTGTIIIGVILFAIASMIIYIWGLSRQYNQNKDLMNLLYSKGVSRVNKYLKKNDKITQKEIENLCHNMTARLPFTSDKAVVRNDRDFSDKLIQYMIRTGQITKENDYYKK